MIDWFTFKENSHSPAPINSQVETQTHLYDCCVRDDGEGVLLVGYVGSKRNN